MDKKITRRVALGSVVVGLTVVPFVVRGIRRSQSREILSEYGLAWKESLSQVQAAIKKTNGPSEFTPASVVVQSGRRFRIDMLTGSYNEYSYPAVFPEPPSFFMRQSVGVLIKHVPGVSSFVLDAEIGDLRSRGWLMDNVIPAETRRIVFSPDGKGVRLFAGTDESLWEIESSEVDPSSLNVATLILGKYPRNRSFAKGSKWVLQSDGESVPYDQAFVMDGYFAVEGKKTVRFLSESKRSHEEVLEDIRKTWELDAKKEGGPKMMGDMQNELEQAKAKMLTKSLKHEVYIDIETGFVWRSETLATIYKGNFAEVDVSSKSIVQTKEC